MKGKVIVVYILLAVVILLFGLFSGHDWTLFFIQAADLKNPEIFSRFLKFPVTFISMVLTWLIAGDGISIRDTNKLRAAYTLIVAGDIIFFFDVHSVIGVFAFALAHLVMIWRNAAGLGSYKSRGVLWVLLAVILLAAVGIMYLVLYPMLKDNLPYFYTLFGYAVIISGSLWAAISSIKIGYFPRNNIILIVAGVACFFLSDICVGLYRALPVGYDRVFATYLTWIFYAPALVLTALSGYDFKKLAPG